MSENIIKLKELWNKYNDTWSGNEEYKLFIEEYPKDKLKNLTLDSYTNIKSDDTVEYFTHFIERKTENCGKFRTSSSFSYGIYKVNANNIDEKKYKDEKEFAKDKYRSLDQKSKFKDFKKKYIDETEAIKYFEDNVTPKLIALSNFENMENTKPLDINYARKVAYMYNTDKLLPIYKKDVIEAISDFLGIKEQIDYSSYKATRKIVLKLLCEKFITKKDLKEDSFATTQKLAAFLWENFGKTVSFDSKNIIYYGAPGTGKTFTVQNTVKQKILLAGDTESDVAVFTQFHPSFGYEDFMDGLKPIIKGSNISLELHNGIFKKLCKTAMDNLKSHRINPKDNKLKTYYFIADEINRADLSTVFGELLLCLGACRINPPKIHNRV